MTTAEISKKIEQAARAAFEGPLLTTVLKGGSRASTISIKAFFRDLGKGFGFKVAAACPDTDEGEWLYDMVWYEVDQQGLLLRQRMVLESELNRGLSVQQNAEVDGDFQKLVQARADVRAWLCSCHSTTLAEQHLFSCKRQIKQFSGTMPYDTYIFIIHDWSASTTKIERFEAS